MEYPNDSIKNVEAQIVAAKLMRSEQQELGNCVRAIEEDIYDFEAELHRCRSQQEFYKRVPNA